MKYHQSRYIKQIMLALIAITGMQLQAIAEEVTITFIQLNDLHANLIGHKDIVRHQDGSTTVGIRGGMARMKTVIDATRKQNPNTVVMNIGDTFHGGVEAFFSLGNAVAEPLNALGIDVGVPGNWDFYYTPAVTRARYGRIDEDVDVIQATLPGIADPVPVKRPNFPNLGANVHDLTDRLPEDFLPPTHMLELSGVKVGFIGFTSDIVELMQPMLAEGMDFAWGLEEHKDLLVQYARALRDQGADIVVLMSELGVPKDMALAKAMAADDSLEPGLIDVFFSAHTHELTLTPVQTAKDGSPLYAPVVEAGNDGYLGRMDITLQYEGTTTTGVLRNRVEEQHWSPVKQQWSLITLDQSIAENAAVKALVDAERAPFLAQQVDIMAVPFFRQHLTQPIDTVIGHVPAGTILHQEAALNGVISRKHSLTSTFNDALTDMLLDITGTDVALTPGFRMDTTLPEAGYIMENNVVASGDITLEDAYRFFPMYYVLATATTTGLHMKQVMEDILMGVYSADTWNTRGGWNYGFGGLDISLDLAAGDQHRVIALRHKDGTPIADDEVLSITGCSRKPIDFNGSLCGIGGFGNVQDVLNPVTGTIWSLVDVFTQTLQDTGYVLEADGTGVSDLSQTPMWPTSEFIQPPEGVGDFYIPHDPNDPCGIFKLNCVQ